MRSIVRSIEFKDFINYLHVDASSGYNSVGRVTAFQAVSGGFESHFPLLILKTIVYPLILFTQKWIRKINRGLDHVSSVWFRETNLNFYIDFKVAKRPANG